MIRRISLGFITILITFLGFNFVTAQEIDNIDIENIYQDWYLTGIDFDDAIFKERWTFNNDMTLDIFRMDIPEFTNDLEWELIKDEDENYVLLFDEFEGRFTIVQTLTPSVLVLLVVEDDKNTLLRFSNEYN